MMYNDLLNSTCETLRKVLKADLHLHSRAPSCWTAQILDGFEGLRRYCAVHGELLREWTREQQITDCRHTKHSLPCLFTTMCASLYCCRVYAVSDFLSQYNKKLLYFLSELSDLILAGVDQPQADQPNSLAE
eukprot:1154193-Pelagomonas_calceolata.AAC.1